MTEAGGIFILTVIVVFFGFFGLLSIVWTRFRINFRAQGTSRLSWDLTPCVCCGSCKKCDGSCTDICTAPNCDTDTDTNTNTGNLTSSSSSAASCAVNRSISRKALMNIMNNTPLGYRLGVRQMQGFQSKKASIRSKNNRRFNPGILDKYADARSPEQRLKYIGLRGTTPILRNRLQQHLVDPKLMAYAKRQQQQQLLQQQQQQKTRDLDMKNEPFRPPISDSTDRNRALIISPGYKDNKDYSLGNNPLNDGQTLQHLIGTFLCMENNIVVMSDDTNTKPTYNNMTSAIQWLPSRAKKGDRYFFGFAGHCHRILNGKEVTMSDGYKSINNDALLSLDLQDVDGAFIWNALVRPLHNTGASLLAAVDACQSGTLFELPHNKRCSKDRTKLEYIKGAAIKEHELLNCNVVLITACSDYQTAKNGTVRADGGAFTIAFKHSLKQNGPNATIEKIVLDAQTFLDNEGIKQDIQVSSMLSSFDTGLAFGNFGICM